MCNVIEFLVTFDEDDPGTPGKLEEKIFSKKCGQRASGTDGERWR